ncbi:death domain-associated protein 6-like [Diachasmimorpha longicaudata]|uniref:death domain-associated protein 6-like n=1 Tax=Diachasmimorpha longicaudata TaxID=58733 RepID=UPI0030B8D337
MADLICISSDDEVGVNKNVDKHKDDRIKKRKASTELVDSLPKKRIQLRTITKALSNRQTSNDVLEVEETITQVAMETTSTERIALKYDGDLPSMSRTEDLGERLHNRPQLTIKEKRPVDKNDIGSEVFSQFLSLCLTKDRSADMKKIVEKLKRRYEQTDTAYVQCPAFINLLNEKRDCLMDKGSVYTHISEINSEMKCRKKGRVTPKEEKIVEESAVEEVNTNGHGADNGEGGENGEGVENGEASNSVNRKIKLLEKAMAKCQERIQQLRDAEVDWDDDENSDFMKMCKYEEKMTKMYAKMCDLTGNDYNAGRCYFKPKKLQVTGIPEVDQAIISFMMKKLKDMKKKVKRGLSSANCVIFPDYCDILNCIKECNGQKNLGMHKKNMEKLAQKAFSDLGNHLQKVRKDDLLDSFALILENESDPAVENPVLLKKLEVNKIAGKKKMDEIFEEFVRRQEEGLIPEDANETGSDADEDKDEDEDDEEAEASGGDDSNGSDCIDESIDSPATKENQNGNPTRCNDSDNVSDSAETVVISPLRVPHRVHQLDDTSCEKVLQRHHVVADVEGTVTIPAEKLKAEGWRSESLIQRNPEPAPTTSQTSTYGKPSIKTIENVKVIIKTHKLVKPFVDKTNSPATLQSQDEKSKEIRQSAQVNTPTTTNPITEIKSSSRIPDSSERTEVHEKFDDSENNVETGMACADHALENTETESESPQPNATVSTDFASEPRDTPSPQTVNNSSSKVDSPLTSQVTSTTEDQIERRKSPELTILEDPDDHQEDVTSLARDSPVPQTMHEGEVKMDDDTKDTNKFEAECSPVLKLRPFAKPPDFWESFSPKTSQSSQIQRQISLQNPIECIDLEDTTPLAENNSSSNAVASPSSKGQVVRNLSSRSGVSRSTAQPKLFRIITKDSTMGQWITSQTMRILKKPGANGPAPSNSSAVIAQKSTPRPSQTVALRQLRGTQLSTTYLQRSSTIGNLSRAPAPRTVINPLSRVKILKDRG